MYNLSVDQDVVKEIKRYPPKHFKQVILKLLSFQGKPRPHDCRKLAGYEGPGYRVDQGEYRILYEVDDRAQHVTVFLIGHRFVALNRCASPLSALSFHFRRRGV